MNTLSDQGFSFLTFEDFLANSSKKIIVLRHDVDALPQNSLEFAKIQADIGIKGTYYFRIVPESFDIKIIKEIYSLGHEIGYHYEDVSLAAKKRQVTGGRRQEDDQNGSTVRLFDDSMAHGTAYAKASTDTAGLKAEGKKGSVHRVQGSEQAEELVSIAIESFKGNLEKLRQIVPVKTICMHGSPISRWDSRLLWKYYDYHAFGIEGEPYFDVDFNEVLYLTDTGRRWDGDVFNIRDKAVGKNWEGREGECRLNDIETKEQSDIHEMQKAKYTSFSPSAFRFPPYPKFHSTFDIVKAAEQGRLPDKIMITFHPQRWTDKPIPWIKELVWQNVKNVVKYFLIVKRDFLF